MDRMLLRMQSASSASGANLPKVPRVGQALVAEVSDIGGSMSAPVVKFISRDHTGDIDVFMPAASLSSGTPCTTHHASYIIHHTYSLPLFLVSPSLTSRFLSILSHSRETCPPDRDSATGASGECAGHTGGGEHGICHRPLQTRRCGVARGGGDRSKGGERARHYSHRHCQLLLRPLQARQQAQWRRPAGTSPAGLAVEHPQNRHAVAGPSGVMHPLRSLR